MDDGVKLGCNEGNLDGPKLGGSDGCAEGWSDGDSDGMNDGMNDGINEGTIEILGGSIHMANHYLFGCLDIRKDLCNIL